MAVFPIVAVCANYIFKMRYNNTPISMALMGYLTYPDDRIPYKHVQFWPFFRMQE